MKTIELEEIMDRFNISKGEMAKELFPGNKYPIMALNRILSGEASLDSNQLSRLSLLTDLSTDEMFSGGGWKAKTKDNIITFQNKDFRAELDTKTWITKIFKKETIFHESIITPSSVSISRYLQDLEDIIAGK